MNATSTFQAQESLSEQIARHIGHLIITGELESKARIQELKICADLGVSRGPVREALLILERRHLVDILPRKGAMVSPLTAHHVNSLYDFYISLLKMLLTGLADAWEELSTLQPLLDKIADMQNVDESSIAEVEAFQESGFELMHQAATIVNNPYLMEALESLRPAIHRTYHLSMQIRNDDTSMSRQFFSSIAQGVTKRNHDLLIEAVEVFANHLRSVVLEALE